MRFRRAIDGARQLTDAGEVAMPAPSAVSAAIAYELSAIELYMTDGRRRGWAATNGRRTSDWLNAADPLPVQGVTAVDIGEPPDPPPSAGAAGGEVSQLAADDVVFVIPPPLPANRHLRLHRRKVHVQVHVGKATISGQAHIRPGAQAGDHIFRSGRRFVPLTDAEVVLDDGSAVWALPVVIINAASVSEIHGIEEPQTTPMPARQPDPAQLAGSRGEAEPGPAPASMGSRGTILLTALELLLAEGVIDLVEFQTKRAKLPAD
ncbi:MAG TPA: hypothetical protein VGB34_02990 [Candidatus Limnocylindria bacterium]|jgi:hypothetical protein